MLGIAKQLFGCVQVSVPLLASDSPDDFLDLAAEPLPPSENITVTRHLERNSFGLTLCEMKAHIIGCGCFRNAEEQILSLAVAGQVEHIALSLTGAHWQSVHVKCCSTCCGGLCGDQQPLQLPCGTSLVPRLSNLHSCAGGHGDGRAR